MKRFTSKQLLSIKENFDCYQDSAFHVSSDKSAINVFLDEHQFYFHKDDDYIYFAIYRFNSDTKMGVCLFRQYFGSFASMMLSLQGFQICNF